VETQKGGSMFFLLNWLENLNKPESPEDLKKRLKSRLKKNRTKINRTTEREEKTKERV
jgi:hypothetical protein